MNDPLFEAVLYFSALGQETCEFSLKMNRPQTTRDWRSDCSEGDDVDMQTPRAGEKLRVDVERR